MSAGTRALQAKKKPPEGGASFAVKKPTLGYQGYRASIEREGGEHELGANRGIDISASLSILEKYLYFFSLRGKKRACYAQAQS
ncbi:hypothetical protein [Comamonas odontotermitis]|uniref:hypothetical protein n=1 Tax=Comamonas odontotermitis TaxID=379895 RepID=UPI001CC7E027|nr:hypothetical protein [Comamonas odontotermitis]UBB18384.1 hypothetical protein LAD35_07030 [Comamonas odontotermitis]